MIPAIFYLIPFRNRILVVDDDTDILTLVKLTLSINGFDVEALSRWENIDTTIDKYNPDLILLDVSLGGADGREICKRLGFPVKPAIFLLYFFRQMLKWEKVSGIGMHRRSYPNPMTLPISLRYKSKYW